MLFARLVILLNLTFHLLTTSVQAMSLSKEDFLAFMAEQQKDRDKETEKLQNFFKESVREEVGKAVTSLVEKQNSLELKQNSLEQQTSSISSRVSRIEAALDDTDLTRTKVIALEKQMTDIQNSISNPTAFTNTASSSSTPSAAASSSTSEPSLAPTPALAVIKSAKTILGFSPITPSDISFLKNKNSLDNDEEARALSIIEFLNDEMKVPSSITDKIVIKRTFPPASKPVGWSTLYAEFDANATDIVHQYARNLQPGKQLSIYVPHSLQPRFRMVNDIAHRYRFGSVKHKTRVKYGVSDFVLYVKPREGNVPWTFVPLNELPPLSLSPFEVPQFLTSSPPPGRDRTRSSSKRARSSSTSPSRDDSRVSRSRVDIAENEEQYENENVDAPPKTLPSPKPTNPSVPDVGSFLPSACASPSANRNKNFTFGSSIPVKKPSLD